MRISSLSVAVGLLGALALTACSKKSACGDTQVSLASWTRQNAQFLPGASYLTPPGAISRTLPAGAGEGETWIGNGWNLYYIADSAYTERTVEQNELVEDYVTCDEEIGGHPAKITLTYSKASGMTGLFGSATWKLPNNHGFYIAMLGSGKSARDSVLAALRAVKLPQDAK